MQGACKFTVHRLAHCQFTMYRHIFFFIEGNIATLFVLNNIRVKNPIRNFSV